MKRIDNGKVIATAMMVAMGVWTLATVALIG